MILWVCNHKCTSCASYLPYPPSFCWLKSQLASISVIPEAVYASADSADHSSLSLSLPALPEFPPGSSLPCWRPSPPPASSSHGRWRGHAQWAVRHAATRRPAGRRGEDDADTDTHTKQHTPRLRRKQIYSTGWMFSLYKSTKTQFDNSFKLKVIF